MGRRDGGFGGFVAVCPTVDNQRSYLWNVVLIAAFILLAAVGILRHEIWRDEAQAWLLARDSESLGALFRSSRYEGHPLLWHFCLFWLAKISHSPLMMQGFNWILAIASAVLVVTRSPFSLLQRGLIAFGYFSFYEYTVLSRSYGMGVCLVFLFCALYGRKQPGYWGLVAVLVLLANTSIFGLAISGSLAIALFYRLFFSMGVFLRRPVDAQLLRTSPRSRWPYYFAVLLLGWVLSGYQVIRAVNENIAQQPVLDAEGAMSWLENVNKLFQILLKSYVPMPNFRFHFWNGHLLEDLSLLPRIGPIFLFISGVLILLVMALAVRLLRKTPVFLWVYGVGTLSMGGLFVFVYRGTTRHYGHLFVLWLACLWLSRWQLEGRWLDGDGKESFWNRLLTGVLCLHAFSGAYAYIADVRFPFSTSYEAASKIEATGLVRLPLLGLHQRPVSPLSVYLDRQIYYPEAEGFGSFWDISHPEIVDRQEVVRSLESFAAKNPAFVAVLTEPLDEDSLSSRLVVHELGDVGPGIVETESFSLYEVERRTE